MALTVPPADRATNLVVWVVLWAALFSWQAVCARSERLPSMAAVVAILRRWWATRWLFLIGGWGWLGWHLFARTHF